MKKDIEFPNVEGVKVAIARKINDLNEVEWDVYLINRLSVDLANVFVNSRGYGHNPDGTEIKTSQLRHFYKDVPAKGIIKVEIITPDVFHLNNEYWVSYFIGNQLFDKKFVFVPESIREENLIRIKQLELEGILHE
ncbi:MULTISPECIES: hypothetical protein [Arcicella]|uniref:Uncharacterized protein n=1 Tax=Arcicella aquatica TaxID=217141 RepID=A0ABU5QSP7_9BACT|nr:MULTISPECIES: hypothetical protein [Arcicella]MDR6564915.1 hypothetical protein [Arcicella sp. BE51]MDR6814705.1 hypothetical protein [Arcicella sp. BE140]MDR6826132.1 hypothetical protein [Arcicella sp. BE139]MEA5259880.1 hypothetical protein [Arcicella aquatica]